MTYSFVKLQNYYELLKKWYDLGLDEISQIHKVNAFNHFIKSLPTTDVEEVVKCRNCKYYTWKQEPCHGKAERFCSALNIPSIRRFLLLSWEVYIKMSYICFMSYVIKAAVGG